MITLRSVGRHIARRATGCALLLLLAGCMDQPKFSGNCTQTELACANDAECVFFLQNGDYTACSAKLGEDCGGYASCVANFQFTGATTRAVLCEHISCLADSGQL
jgi:hypothetical protein